MLLKDKDVLGVQCLKILTLRLLQRMHQRRYAQRRSTNNSLKPAVIEVVFNDEEVSCDKWNRNILISVKNN